MNQLEQLKRFSSVVIDTGDMDMVRNFTPVDATTNPSLIYKAAQLPRYQDLIKAILHDLRHRSASLWVGEAVDRIAVALGKEMLSCIPGRVSTEVDARLSFDTAATVQKARQLIAYYRQQGIDRERILIKIAGTWEGIQAASVLEREAINTNITLIFSLQQAEAAAQAGATLISPFVGRILDWYRQRNPQAVYTGDQDPGVQSVRAIYQRFKACGYATVVMAASFRDIDEIRNLAGCDKLTLAPKFLEALLESNEPLQRHLQPVQSASSAIIPTREQDFRWTLNENAMATEKLAEGIRLFTEDLRALEQQLQQLKANA
ncbi:MAG: transaldolase [Pseudomonadales bacterium]|nr:transaldolase [Pseudomonadales bacterium]